jgi:hypothetical protein
MPIVIDFAPDGAVEAMHRDEFDLGFLGAKSIARASEIEFNEETQLWDIWLIRPGKPRWLSQEARGFSAYDVARSVEVAWLDRCRAEGVEPTEGEGCEILHVLRTMVML